MADGDAVKSMMTSFEKHQQEMAAQRASEIDWETRRWQAAVAAMQGFCVNPGANELNCTVWERAVYVADQLVVEYRGTEAE